MTSSRPYLIRALYEWIVDNQCTPYLLVDAAGDGVQVPSEYIDNGKIVLNISPSAVQQLLMSNEQISFSARFSGQSRALEFPVTNVLAIYARENGQGMMFSDEESGGKPPPVGSDQSASGAGSKPVARKPALKVVK